MGSIQHLREKYFCTSGFERFEQILSMRSMYTYLTEKASIRDFGFRLPGVTEEVKSKYAAQDRRAPSTRFVPKLPSPLSANRGIFAEAAPPFICCEGEKWLMCAARPRSHM